MTARFDLKVENDLLGVEVDGLKHSATELNAKLSAVGNRLYFTQRNLMLNVLNQAEIGIRVSRLLCIPISAPLKENLKVEMSVIEILRGLNVGVDSEYFYLIAACMAAEAEVMNRLTELYLSGEFSHETKE